MSTRIPFNKGNLALWEEKKITCKAFLSYEFQFHGMSIDMVQVQDTVAAFYLAQADKPS